MCPSPLIPLASIFACVSFMACIVALAVSPAKWETFKRMIMILASCAAGIFVMGLLAAMLLDSDLLARLTGVLLVGASPLAAATGGWFHVRAARKAEGRRHFGC